MSGAHLYSRRDIQVEKQHKKKTKEKNDEGKKGKV
jgi:hypothetical protein